jgi:hypothetical protein
MHIRIAVSVSGPPRNDSHSYDEKQAARIHDQTTSAYGVSFAELDLEDLNAHLNAITAELRQSVIIEAERLRRAASA